MTIEETLARKLFPTHLSALTWAQMVAAVQAGDATEKLQIVGALSQTRPNRAGVILQQLVNNYVQGLATAEATEMMADDQLSRTELEKILP